MLEKRFLFADSNQNVVQLGALCNADAMHYIMCQDKIHTANAEIRRNVMNLL